MYRRAGRFYCEDTETRKQLSLRTRDEAEAPRVESPHAPPRLPTATSNRMNTELEACVLFGRISTGQQTSSTQDPRQGIHYLETPQPRRLVR